MVQVRGPRLKQLQRAELRYSAEVIRSVNRVLREAASEVDDSPTDELGGVIRTRWATEVTNSLLPALGSVWRDAANDTRAKLQRIANQLAPSEAVTAAAMTTELRDGIDGPIISKQVIDTSAWTRSFQDEELPDAETPPPPAPGAFVVPPPGEELLDAYLSTRENFLVGVSDYVWDAARAELLEGIEEGESIAQLRDRIRQSVNFSAARATRVARTEAVGAANAGSLQQMQSSGLRASKEWLATNDSRTREDHRDVDGQTVDLNESFDVGGSNMQRPHDPAGPAEQVVNCRCTLVYDFPEEDLMPEAEAITAAGEKHTSGMIALVPSDEDLDRLTLEDGEPRDELHLTLWFLGDADNFNEDARNEVVKNFEHQLSHYDDMRTFVDATAFGINYWNPASDDPAWVLAVGDRRGDDDNDTERVNLYQLHAMAGDALADLVTEGIEIPTQHSPWVPHVTLTYGTDTEKINELQDRLGDITFDRVRFAFGDDVRDISLSGDPVTLTSSGGSGMPFSKVQDHADCSSDEPWAVVKDDTGELMGCHATEEEADDQIAALNIAEREEETATNDVTTFAVGDKDDDDEDDNMLFTEAGTWEGVIAVEGTPTGDGREFAPESLTWENLPVPLRHNIEDSHGGEPKTTAVLVGRIDEIWRDGSWIMGRGVFDMGGEHGREAHRLVKEGFLKGVSVDVDDISEADVEVVMPDDEGGEDDIFVMPEKMIFHKGRIRAATLVDIPAFVEASIQLVDEDGEGQVASMTARMFGAVATHSTETIDTTWDAALNEKRLDSPVSLDRARDVYAWIDDAAVEDDAIPKTAGKFIHHEVNADGTPGAANLTACSAGIAVLNGARGGADIPAADRRGVWEHLAAHLRDADQEPPPLQLNDETVTASVEVDDRPPSSWFENPKLSLPTPITVTDSGRIYGHAAMWGECHIGHSDMCVTAPFEDAHPYYMTGEVVCNDGVRRAVGQITVGTGHAPMHVGASRAVEHYDNTGAAVADVVVGNDEHGIWVAGAIRPNADAARVRDLRAAGQVSGDWRRIGGELRLVGLLAVNVPGFPIPKTRARVASGSPLALVAAGKPVIIRPQETEEEMNKRALKYMRERLMERVLGDKKG